MKLVGLIAGRRKQDYEPFKQLKTRVIRVVAVISLPNAIIFQRIITFDVSERISLVYHLINKTHKTEAITNQAKTDICSVEEHGEIIHNCKHV